MTLIKALFLRKSMRVLCVYLRCFFLRSATLTLAVSMCFLVCSAEKTLCTQYDSSQIHGNTRTKHAQDKTHNSTPGGEINRIQAG